MHKITGTKSFVFDIYIQTRKIIFILRGDFKIRFHNKEEKENEAKEKKHPHRILCQLWFKKHANKSSLASLERTLRKTNSVEKYWQQNIHNPLHFLPPFFLIIYTYRIPQITLGLQEARLWRTQKKFNSIMYNKSRTRKAETTAKNLIKAKQTWIFIHFTYCPGPPTSLFLFHKTTFTTVSLELY